MRIFEQDPDLDDAKINFIDKNNVFVGFDYTNKCCENFGYTISENKLVNDNEYNEYNEHDNLKYNEYIFDTSFHEIHSFVDTDSNDDDPRCYHVVIFKLISELTGKELYLTLYNSHNGYYAHGFEFKHNEHLLYTGSL